MTIQPKITPNQCGCLLLELFNCTFQKSLDDVSELLKVFLREKIPASIILRQLQKFTKKDRLLEDRGINKFIKEFNHISTTMIVIVSLQNSMSL